MRCDKKQIEDYWWIYGEVKGYSPHILGLRLKNKKGRRKLSKPLISSW